MRLSAQASRYIETLHYVGQGRRYMYILPLWILHLKNLARYLFKVLLVLEGRR